MSCFPVGGYARKYTADNQQEGHYFKGARCPLLPHEAIEQCKQGLKQNHLPDHGQGKETAHPVPQDIAADGGKERDPNRNRYETFPPFDTMVYIRQQPGHGYQQHGLCAGHHAG